jgi:vacuolar-type H+-ATPase subunit C/Vma6
MTDDYGLARVAALRGRLLDASTLGQLRGAATAAAFLRSLERSEDWGPVVRLVAPLAGDPLAAADAAIERHRSLRIGRLPRWFEPPTRRLVEALVLPLDRERCIALLRLRRSGAGAEAIGALVAPGALLDAAALDDLARAPALADIVARLAVAGLVAPEHVPGLLRAAGEAGDPAGWGAFEARLDAAVEEARALRAAGRSENARFVAALLDREARERRAVAAELASGGATSAVRLERALVLARLGTLARRARRAPLSIAPVAGYVAAVELQAIRLRAIVARLRSGWTGDPFRAGDEPAAGVPGPGSEWPAAAQGTGR